MATERSSNCVLAKMMGFDRLSIPKKTHVKRRVLSENYFQNIASVVHREKSPLDLEEDDFNMDIDTHSGNQDTVETSEGSEIAYASLNTKGLNSSLRNNSNKKFLSEIHRFELFGSLELQDSANSSSHLKKSTVLGSSSTKKQELSGARVKKYIKNSAYGSDSSNWVKEDNDCYLPTKIFARLKESGEKSSYSSVTPGFGGREQNITSSVNHKGMNFRKNRMKSSYNGNECLMQDSVFPQEIAKQITSEVKNSLWHVCREPSTSGFRSDNSSVSEHEKIMPLSSSLPELQNNHEATSCDLSVKTFSFETENTKKQSYEKWRTKKCSQEMRSSYGKEIQDKIVGISTWSKEFVPEKNDVYYDIPFKSSNIDSSRVVAARYLAKPILFPSAWVFRSRNADIMLDKNWSLRLGNRNSDHNVLRSSSDPIVLPTLSISKSSEESVTAQEYFSVGSTIPEVESPTYLESHTFLNDNVEKLLKDDNNSIESSVASSSNHSYAPVNVEFEQADDCENEKRITSVDFQWRHLQEEPTEFALMERTGSDSQSCFEHKLNDSAAFQPRSPVSSLEGPEACGQLLEEIASVHESFLNDLHGLQTKLRLIEAVSVESGSEGPGMMISSDEGDDAGSVGHYREDAQIMEIPSLSENRDFSYLVDVLAKSGFPLWISELETQTYCSPGYVLCPSLFKSLEEKYGKQTIWERSDRMLLFDRINTGLMEIAQPLVGINTWRKPVAKRVVSLSRGQKTIEEQLWDALVNQKDEYKKQSSDKIYGREIEWIELEEDISFLVNEMECFLIDELIDEFVEEVFGEA